MAQASIKTYTGIAGTAAGSDAGAVKAQTPVWAGGGAVFNGGGQSVLFLLPLRSSLLRAGEGREVAVRIRVVEDIESEIRLGRDLEVRSV